MRTLRLEIESAFGISTRLLRMIVGPVLFLTSKREDRRLAEGIDLRAALLRRAKQLG